MVLNRMMNRIDVGFVHFAFDHHIVRVVLSVFEWVRVNEPCVYLKCV
jgi:hypothetical protein